MINYTIVSHDQLQNRTLAADFHLEIILNMPQYNLMFFF